MQGTVKLFCESLARQIEQYRALLEITRRERRCLGNKDLEGMRTIIKEKEAVLGEISLLDRARRKYADELAGYYRLNAGNVRLSELIPLVTAPYSDELARLQAEIKRINADLSSLNERNLYLTEFFSKFADDIKKIFVSGISSRGRYTRSGGMDPAQAKKIINRSI
jgi:flagellar biosynthesis/type III secretory pathway chaperone